MVVNSPFVSVQNMPTEEYLRRAGYPPGPCWYSHARVCTPCLPCYRNKCLACGGAHVCLCALVCKRRTGRYTTRQMLAELHSALRSMVAEEQDTKLYALPQLPVSYRFLPQKLLSKADAHGTATSHAGASAGCAYVRGSAPDLCAWAYARALVPIGSRGPPARADGPRESARWRTSRSRRRSARSSAYGPRCIHAVYRSDGIDQGCFGYV
jgi:hypothetical protein